MVYLPDLHTYLHQSSLLTQAYPQTTRITTKYSLPKKGKARNTTDTDPPSAEAQDGSAAKRKREPSATLTLKTYHPESGICLKYKTDKAAEVGRLMTGLGRLVKGEVIEPSRGDGADAMAGAGIEIGSGQALGGTDKMDVDAGAAVEAKTATQMTQAGQPQQPSDGRKKKKKNKK